jgi:hypothetical protein
VEGVAEISEPGAREAGPLEKVFGTVALVVGLAVVAPLPLLGLGALGYATLAEARVARTGRLRDALFGAVPAARLATFGLGAWGALLPARHLAARAHDARLVEPDGNAAAVYAALWAVALVLGLAYLASVALQGGRARDFLRPRVATLVREIAVGRAWARLRDGVWRVFARGVPLLTEGARALLVGVAWLCVPTLLLFVAARATSLPRGVTALAYGVGGVLLSVALLAGPFAQGRAALHGSFRAGLDVRATFAAIARAPLAALLATLVTLALAAPLHLLKIEPLPEASWLPSLVFVLFGLPSRALAGWALARSGRRARPAHVALRVLARGIALTAAVAYVALVVLSEYTSWRGAESLFEQHVLLVPTPFLPG